ncbi:MAG: hypothetical protein JXR94_17350 [Candidatus Hydrogenedentes bacterium]|nr:hypothetical protein [Candidatus Hydrogenedentota bacterium]
MRTWRVTRPCASPRVWAAKAAALVVLLCLGVFPGRAQEVLPREAGGSSPATPQWAKGARVLGVRYEDIERLPQIREKYHANVLILYHVPETSNGWCPEGTWDEVARFVEEAHNCGMKVMGYFDGTYAEEKFHAGEHVNWVQRNRQGQPQHYQPDHIRQHRYCYCFNSPWHDRWTDIARREAELGMDGMFVDNPDYMDKCGESCFCEHCQKLFREHTGMDIFTAPDEVRRNWLSGRLAWHVRDIYDTLKRTNPDKEFVVTSNTCGSSRHRSMRVLGPAGNVLFRESGGTQRDCRAMVRDDQYDGGRKPLWFILTTGAEWAPETGRVYERLIASVVSAGGCPMVWAHNYSDDPDKPGFSERDTIFTHPQVAAAVADSFTFIEQHLDLVADNVFFRTHLKTPSEGIALTASHTADNRVVIQVVNDTDADLTDVDIQFRLPKWVAPRALRRLNPRPLADAGFSWTPSDTGYSRLQVNSMRVWDVYVSEEGASE